MASADLITALPRASGFVERAACILDKGPHGPVLDNVSRTFGGRTEDIGRADAP
jgi:hypothetical protein